jgi:peptidoglycan hydrolase-like protein with peptidoglycan-binding domain
MMNGVNSVLFYMSSTAAKPSRGGGLRFENWETEEIKKALETSDFSMTAPRSLAPCPKVAVAQRAFISLGLLSIEGNMNSKGEPDGKLGPRTLSAVKDLRKITASGETFEGLTENDISCLIEMLEPDKTEDPAPMPLLETTVGPDPLLNLGIEEPAVPLDEIKSVENIQLTESLGFSLVRNEIVAAIQQELIARGLLSLRGNQDASGAPDGKAGNRTFEGILKLRQANGIEDVTKQITQMDVDLLAGRAGAAAGAISEKDAVPGETVVEIVVEENEKTAANAIAEVVPVAKETPLEEEINGYVKAADRAVRYMEAGSLILSTVSEAFIIDRSRPQGERAAILMAKETYLADYFMDSGDLHNALNRYMKICRMFTRPSRDRIVNIGEFPSREVEKLAEKYVYNAHSRSRQIITVMNDSAEQQDPAGDA